MNLKKKDRKNSPEQTANHTPIARKAAIGVFWSLMSNGLAKGLGLLSLSILAHLLLKDDFGDVAAAMIALNYLSIFKDFGLGVALIQRRGDIEEAANTVFMLNIAMGVVLATLAFVCASFIAAYFKEPQLSAIVRWLGLSFLINSAGAVHIIRLKRELAFRKKLIPDLANAIVKGAVSITMAFSGFGVWSLVFGQLAGAAVGVIVVWFIVPWRPRLAFNRSLAGSLLKFGGAIMGLDALTVISENLASIVIGRVCGMALLGVFTLSYRLPQVLLIGNLWVMAEVAFPAFSVIQNQPDEIRTGFLTTVRLVGLVASPLCLGMLLAADPMIRVIFGSQWLEAIPILRILAIFAWVYSIGFHVGDIYKATGKPDILLKLAVLYLPIQLAALLIGARYGLIGIATNYLLAIMGMKFIELKIATKLIDVKFSDILKELSPALICGAVLTALALAVLSMTKYLAPSARLLIVTLVCAAGYLAVLWNLEKENICQLVRLVRVQA